MSRVGPITSHGTGIAVSTDPPPCIRIKTDQYGDIPDLIDLTSDFEGLGPITWEGQTSGATGTHRKFLYGGDLSSPTPAWQQYILLKDVSGVFSANEDLHWFPADTPSAEADSGIDCATLPENTPVDCTTGMDPNDPNPPDVPLEELIDLLDDVDPVE